MKKEKKAIVKNSEYYFKKVCPVEILKRFFVPSVLSLFPMVGIMSKRSINYSDKEFEIKDKSGYTQYIESEKSALEEKRNNGEISQNVYEAYMEDLANQSLEGYLKKTENAYYLAEYKKNNDARNNEIATIGLADMAFVVTLGGIELVRTSVCLAKGKKLAKQEKDKEEELKRKYGKEFEEFIKNNPDALLPPEQKTYTDLNY